MVNGVSEEVLKTVEELREYVFAKLQDAAFEDAEYTAAIELLIADLENAPPYDEL